jgi:magnesium chelatase subunit I
MSELTVPDDFMSARYPFSAIPGKDELKLALLLTAVDPLIGGLLAFGDRGTGKSTAVRALAALLPEIRATSCAYHCDPDQPSAHVRGLPQETTHKIRKIPIPVVDLPLGATEDRVLGALNLERALSHGEKHSSRASSRRPTAAISMSTR